MTPLLYARLSALMLFQYLIPGAYLVTLGTYLLTTLNFTGSQVGLVFSTFAVGAVVSPLISGVVADRYMNLEKLLAFCYIAGGAMLWWCTAIHEFAPFFAVLLGFEIVMAPTFGLSSSLVFHHTRNAQKDFPRIRVWGTIGWIIAGILVGVLGIESTVWPLRIAGTASILTGLYSLTLPATPPPGRTWEFTWRTALGLDALQMLRQREIAIVVGALLLLTLPTAFYHSFTNPFLNELGMEHAAGKMTIGQMTEIVIMLLLPWLLQRFRIRYIILAGILIWAIRYGLFAFGAMEHLFWMLYIGIALHGAAYAFTALSAQIYIDRHAPPELRSSAQGLITIITMGAGRFVGTILAGSIVHFYTLPLSLHNWPMIWLWPALIALIVAAGYLSAISSRRL